MVLAVFDFEYFIYIHSFVRSAVHPSIRFESKSRRGVICNLLVRFQELIYKNISIELESGVGSLSVETKGDAMKTVKRQMIFFSFHFINMWEANVSTMSKGTNWPVHSFRMYPIYRMWDGVTGGKMNCVSLEGEIMVKPRTPNLFIKNCEMEDKCNALRILIVVDE